MRQIDNYISEKLHLGKDTKYKKIVPIPTTIDEFIELVETYFEEWWKNYFNIKPETEISSNIFKEKYNTLISDAKSDMIPLKSLLEELPVKFIQYMKEKYKFNYEED